MSPTRRRLPEWLGALVALFGVLAISPAARADDFSIRRFSAEVNGRTVTYTIEVCDRDDRFNAPTVDLYHDSDQEPGEGVRGDQIQTATGFFNGCRTLTMVWRNAPIGLYRSWLRVDADGRFFETNENNNTNGPLRVLVGPDLYLQGTQPLIDGATVRYRTEVCNGGSEAAGKLRVAFFVDRPGQPSEADLGDIFEPFESLGRDECEEVILGTGNLENGPHSLWARADAAYFVVEGDESNNLAGPLNFDLSNPDLEITSFTVSVRGRQVSYEAEVCNFGTSTAARFWVDLYFDLEDGLPPGFGVPGDEVARVDNLGPNRCTSVSWIRDVTPDGRYESYVMADADDFISEPDESNNQEGPLEVFMPDCVDRDEDGFGAGTACTQPDDCNDQRTDVNPAAREICGDAVDQDCDGVPDDGCPEGCVGFVDDCVDPSPDDPDVTPNPTATPDGPCADEDGDGAGIGSGCPRGPDCDDTDPTVFPGAPEQCGDRIDDDCDQTPDDGCEGVTCFDGDGDGWGVGPDCVLADCDDRDPGINPGADERCGDGRDQDCDGTPDDGCPGSNCLDNDGDGWGVGAGCAVEDCDDANPAVFPRGAEVCDNLRDDDCDGTIDDGCGQCVDRDGDGVGGTGLCFGPLDCDDDDPLVFPGAAERCEDGTDDDCDVIPDDSCLTCADLDEDGWGVGGCGAGRIDCDEGNPAINPGATEECNGVDDDCDGTIDEGCPGVACTDGDGDGWGVGDDCVRIDCDDSDPSIFPFADEICEDGIDQDCNATPDDGCPGVACTDDDGDGWGQGEDCVLQDCDDTEVSVNPRAVDLCRDGIDQDCDGRTDENCPGCEDADGDDFGIGEACGAINDCDDTNPARFPGAEELCNGIDDDCDGLPDDGCETCTDNDEDGAGVGGGCGPLLRWDCDDTDSKRFPGAEELCGDGVDNDCDRSVDEGCPGVQCIDGDNDGWGRGTGCGGPTDCDDGDPNIHPAAVEVCGDGVDQDCDRTPDDGCEGVLCTDSDLDGIGAGPDCILADCDDSETSVSPGSPELCGDNIDQDCDGEADDGCGVICPDGDGDGWGTGPDCARADCDDDAPSIHPGAVDICGDNIDQDCDGVLDTSCPLCADADGDGYGIGPACLAPDCNDEDASIYPGAPELCDGEDTDCDGVVPPSELEDGACLDTGSSACAQSGSFGWAWMLLALWAQRRRSAKKMERRGSEG